MWRGCHPCTGSTAILFSGIHFLRYATLEAEAMVMQCSIGLKLTNLWTGIERSYTPVWGALHLIGNSFRVHVENWKCIFQILFHRTTCGIHLCALWTYCQGRSKICQACTQHSFDIAGCWRNGGKSLSLIHEFQMFWKVWQSHGKKVHGVDEFHIG